MLNDIRFALRAFAKPSSVAAVLGVVAFAAAYVPARRAARMAPLVVLRVE